MLFALLLSSAAAVVRAQTPAMNPAANRAAVAPNADNAVAVALNWLAMIDRNDAKGSYQAASPLMKRTLPLENWITYLNGIRAQKGAISAREWFRIERTVSPKGLPAGEYRMIYFLVNGEKAIGGAEQVSLVQTANGWLPVGYQVIK